MNCDFTFEHYQQIFQNAKNNGYKIVSCLDYFLNYKKYKNQKIFINRVDIDLSCEKAKRACEIFNELDINGSFFIRLHAEEYNIFSFKNFFYLRYIKDSGNEIGLHSEIIDCNKIFSYLPEYCLKKDVDILNIILNINIKGLASHNNVNENNNLDFWKSNDPKNFNLIYEAYNPILFNNFYTSDSLVTKWKCYNSGIEITGDNRCICDHLKDNHRIVYCLTHPVQYS